MPTMIAAQKTPQYKVVCSACGSENVVIDAWASWDAPNQRWRLAEHFEFNCYCRNCDGESSIRTKSAAGRRSTSRANQLSSRM